ncbi:SDR family NAD(P)-dependent oxidoreductase [Halanaerobaculum tunisiense]
MKQFGFVIHPLQAADVARKFPVAKAVPDRLVEKIIKLAPAFKTSHITGIKSRLDSRAEGWFITCPLTSRQMLELPTEEVIERIIAAGRKAEELGAEIVGLGAFTSVVGDKGVTVARELDIPVTTGNSYTVATALEGTKLACRMAGVDIKDQNVLIVGATGSIGQACTKLLAADSQQLILAARKQNKLEELAQEVTAGYSLDVKTTVKLNKYLPQADVIIAASSAVDNLLQVDLLKSGAIICDVARPRDVGKEVINNRSDVLVIDGGIVKVPGAVKFNLDFGFPVGTAYACMAETMILALEGKYENYSLGANLDCAQIKEINKLAKKHGFSLASLRSLDQELSLQQVNKVREVLSST